jgi:2'-5' RNA ligase
MRVGLMRDYSSTVGCQALLYRGLSAVHRGLPTVHILYNPPMPSPQYAVVAYVKAPAGLFLEGLRREVYPAHAHLPAHLTILPPRRLLSAEPAAVAALRESCREVAPFEVVLGEVASFAPVTPTVFLQIEHGAYRMRELHDRLNLAVFQQDEPWPYMPHLTVVKMETLPEAAQALADAIARWAEFRETRRIRVEELTFVREVEGGGWADVAPVPLGRGVQQASR